MANPISEGCAAARVGSGVYMLTVADGAGYAVPVTYINLHCKCKCASGMASTLNLDQMWCNEIR
eukprot:scaffold8354_cov19-Tisochrysis_lutea.AAC.1